MVAQGVSRSIIFSRSVYSYSESEGISGNNASYLPMSRLVVSSSSIFLKALAARDNVGSELIAKAIAPHPIALGGRS